MWTMSHRTVPQNKHRVTDVWRHVFTLQILVSPGRFCGSCHLLLVLLCHCCLKSPELMAWRWDKICGHPVFFQLDRGPWDYTFVVVFVRRFLHISAEQYNHIFLIAIMSEWPSSIVFNFTQLLICTSLTMNNNALSPCISGQWILNLLL